MSGEVKVRSPNEMIAVGCGGPRDYTATEKRALLNIDIKGYEAQLEKMTDKESPTYKYYERKLKELKRQASYK